MSLNLAAALVVRNERARFLEPCMLHLAEFCDQILVLDDASDDGTSEWLAAAALGIDILHVVRQPESTFYVHEGRTRQKLLDMTLATKPDWVLSIDADEFVSHGHELRSLLGHDPNVTVWSLVVEEVWNARPDALETREDGGWRAHALPVVWKVPSRMDRDWRIMDRKLACRRVPIKVLRTPARPSFISLLHFGWTDKATRISRHARYTKHDGGRFHASAHLRSILLPDEKIKLCGRPWPVGQVFDGLRERFSEDEEVAVPRPA